METRDFSALEAALRDRVLDRWVPNTRPGNHGAAGNALEDLLGVKENNLKIPDWGIFELKTHRLESGTLLTLLHSEPQPGRAIPRLLTSMGWAHAEAGRKYGDHEKSFRSTTSAIEHTVRGFTIEQTPETLALTFDPEKVSTKQLKHEDWLKSLDGRVPHYSSVLPLRWNKEDLYRKIRDKLNDTILVNYRREVRGGVSGFTFESAHVLHDFNPTKFDLLVAQGRLVIDFDARTGHNHGTKFRVKRRHLSDMFDSSADITPAQTI
ncbi:MAG: MvaI/BcnI family restriction endonuclease [Leucobacter sp.]|uniref:MvaI/BcnI family restriction endonuclease n=1 Tax=Flaviflexus sp. TaxID=1969482 RepID=UPI003F92C5F3